MRDLEAFLRHLTTLLLLSAAGMVHAGTAPQQLSLGGQLFDASGVAITSANVNFRIQVYDATETCVLYSEDHVGENLAAAQGHFNLILGSGTSKTNNVGTAGALDGKVFANSGSTAIAGCPASPLNLGAGQERQIHVLYDLGAGFVTMTPAVPIVASAYALVADSLNGLNESNFIQVNGTSALTQANEEYAFSLTNWPRLKALLDGTSSQYLPSTPTVPLDVNGQRITDLHDPTSAQDAATKHYADTNLGGSALDLTAVGPMTGAGSTLLWDATANKWVAGTVSSSPTGAAGGDLTGTYPNPTVANDKITSAKINSTGIAVNRLVITNATDGTTLGYGACTVAGQVYAWTASGWACASVSSLAAVTSVAGKTGAVTLNAADIGGLGTSALFDWGTAANQIVRLDGSARLPSVDGSLLTNVNAVQLQGRGVASVAPSVGQVLGWNGSAWTPVAISAGSVSAIASGTGLLGGPITSTGTLSVDTGTTANQILQLNASAQVPAVDGSLIANVNAVKLQSRTLSAAAPAAGQYIGWNAAAVQWEPMAGAGGTVTSIATTNGLLGGTITGAGTLSVDTGTAANKILQLNASAQLPSVDGSLLTQVNAVKLQARTVAATAPSAGQVLGWNAATTQWEPTTGAAGTVTGFTTGTGLLGGPITSTGTISVDVGTAANDIVQENAGAQIAQSSGSAALPSYSFAGNTGTGMFSPGANQLSLSTNGSAALSILPSGFVGIGNTAPISALANTIHSIGDGVAATDTPSLTWAITKDTAYAAGIANTFNGTGAHGLIVSVGGGYPSQKILTLRSVVAGNAFVVTGTGLVGIGSTAPQAGLDVNLTGTAASAMIIPRDTTGNRPGGVNGMLRYNTSTSAFEGFANGAWSTIAAGSAAGTLTNIASGTGLLGGPITSSGTLSVNVGTAANQIPQLNSGAQLALQSGSYGAPAYAFGAFPKTGVMLSNPNEMSFVNNGTSAFTLFADLTAAFASSVTLFQNKNADLTMTVQNPNAGYAASLQTNAQSYYSNASFSSYVGGTGTNWAVGMNGDGRFSLAQNGSSFPFIVENGAPTYALYLQTSGDVGIGTANPLAALDVYAVGTAASAMLIPRDTTSNRPGGVNGMIRYNTTSNAFEGYANGAWGGLAAATTGPWTVNSPDIYYQGGQVGIGTASMDHVLDVWGDASNRKLAGITDTTPSAQDVGGVLELKGLDGSTDRAFAAIKGGKQNGTSGNYDGYFAVFTRSFADNGNSEKMRITAQGLMGIATTSPKAALDVAATGSSSAIVVPRDTAANRPAPVNGMIRYNTDAQALEAYVNGAWVQVTTQATGSVTPVATSGPPVNAGTYAISSVNANYTPGFGAIANTYNGNWPAVGTAANANPSCAQLRTLLISSDTIVYDLGANRTIGHVYISGRGAAYGPFGPSVAFSTDNVTFNSSFTSYLTNSSNIEFSAFTVATSVTARYVRVTNGGWDGNTGTNDTNQMIFCQIAFGP